MVCDVKTISNDGAIVKRLGTRDVSIGQKKRPNNAEKRPYEMHVGADKIWLVERAIEKGRPNNAEKRP